MKLSTTLLACLGITFYYNVNAEVVTDGSMGTTAFNHSTGALINPLDKNLSMHILPLDSNKTITISQDMGTKSGDNLFHSFKTFNINTGETATFTAADSFKNVISRVTGGEISHIDGLLKSEIAGSNFYFINPAGIFFHEHASVDVPAAFHISASDSLNFKDGHTFLASLNSNTSSLSVAEPTDFGFLNKMGDINIKSNFHKVFDENGNSLGYVNYLHFDHQNDILLNAKDIILDAGVLRNPSGEIAVFAKGELKLSNKSSIDNNPKALDAGNLTITANDITLDNKSSIESNLAKGTMGNSGKVTIIANNMINLLGESTIANSSKSGSSGKAGDINIQAKLLNIDTGIIHSVTGTEKNTGNIVINSDKIVLNNNGEISETTTSNANTGNIEIHSTTLEFDNKSFIKNDTNAVDIKGNAGNITINSDKIILDNNSEISETTINNGNTGNIQIHSTTLDIDNTSVIKNNTNAADTKGNAGNVAINSDNITVKNEASIASETYSNGNAGNITLQAKNLVLDNGLIRNDIATNSSQGKSGIVKINSDAITIENGGVIGSSTWGSKSGGTILIQQAKTLNMSAGSIKSESHSTGDAGIISINSDELNLDIIDYGKQGIIGSEISSSTHSEGKAGSVVVQANTVNINGEGSKIAAFADNFSTGHTGNVSVVAKNAISLNNNGIITITNNATDVAAIANKMASNIESGVITVSAPNITLINGSSITTESVSNIDSGKVNLSFAHLLTLNNSTINTKTHEGNGGDVNIQGGHVINLENNAIIKTFTDTKPSTDVTNVELINKGGNVNITANILMMNTAQILAKMIGAESKTGGYANLVLKALIPSQNQLIVNNKTIANFESNAVFANVMRTADSGWATPQLNLSGSLSALNRNMINLPDLNKGSCDDVAILHSTLTKASKGGVPINETKLAFTPPVSIISIASEQLQSAITPLLATSTVTAYYPCSSLSL